METRSKSTTAGLSFWTPAPRRSSPSSSEEEWEDEDEDKAENEEEFLSQMDENGVIGLREALEGLDLREAPGDRNPAWYDGRPDPARHDEEEMDLLPEELSELQGSETSTHYEATVVSVKEWAEEEEEEVSQREEEEERQAESHGAEGNDCIVLPTRGTSNISSPVLLRSLGQSPSAFPHLLHISAEEIADAPQMEAEPSPEVVVSESPSESPSRHVSHKLDSLGPHGAETASEKHPAASPKTLIPVLSARRSGPSVGPVGASGEPGHPHHQPTPSLREVRQNSPKATYSGARSLRKVRASSSKPNSQTTSPETETRPPTEVSCKARAGTPAAEMDGSSKAPQSRRLPDFSKVEPRVRFPKSGYMPPKSRPFSMYSSSAQPALMFKSPADIVKEVLLCGADGAPPSSDPTRPPTSGPNFTVPEDFRCPRQATTLVEQLQEDYDRLLTKYADAENTIDRLRLEAKVKLYSDPPQPIHSMQAALKQEGSKFMMLNFPQAQRAEISSSSLSPNGLATRQRAGDSPARPSSATSSSSRRSLGSQVGQLLTKTLCKQADRFLQQLQTFEDLLKSGKLKAFDQLKGFSRLVEGLDSLERGYLMMREEHQLLQLRGAEIGCFDPNRELEELIFQCGMYVEELKEQVEETPPPPLLAPAEGAEPAQRPESSPVPVNSGRVSGFEVSSASKESDEEEAEEMEDEESLSSVFREPVNDGHKLPLRMQIDLWQSFELPNLLDQSVREGGRLSPGLGDVLQHEEEEERGQSQGTRDMEVQNFLPQRRAESRHRDSPPPTSKSDPPSPAASRRLRPPIGAKYHSSSLTSLGESAASERRSSKLQPGCHRLRPQDGIISPETDSGFICSESSRQTPAAGPGPLHQRATASVSAPCKGNPETLQRSPASGPPPPPPASSSSSHRRISLEHSSDSLLSRPAPKPGQPWRARKGDRRGTSASSSSQRRAGRAAQTRTDSGTSEFEPESHHTHTASEAAHSDPHGFLPSPSPATPHHHGDPLREPIFSPVPDHNEAIQELLAEVSRLQRRLQSRLRDGDPLVSPTAAGSTQRDHASSTPRIRSRERLRDVSWGRRKRGTVEEEEEWTSRPAARKRSARRQKPQLDTSSATDSERPKTRLRHRHTQTPPAALERNCSRSDAARSRTSPTRQRPGSDEPDRGSQTSACPQCLSQHRGRSQGTFVGDRDSTLSSAHPRLCLHCGRTAPIRNSNTASARWREPHSTHTGRRSEKSPERAARGQYVAAATPPMLGGVPLLQCVPVCPSPLLLYSTPVMSTGKGASPGVRGHEEQSGRSLSADEQHGLNRSLNQAIRAATNMKHTSRHMARSLATGLQYQELLSQSWIY